MGRATKPRHRVRSKCQSHNSQRGAEPGPVRPGPGQTDDLRTSGSSGDDFFSFDCSLKDEVYSSYSKERCMTTSVGSLISARPSDAGTNQSRKARKRSVYLALLVGVLSFAISSCSCGSGTGPPPSTNRSVILTIRLPTVMNNQGACVPLVDGTVDWGPDSLFPVDAETADFDPMTAPGPDGETQCFVDIVSPEVTLVPGGHGSHEGDGFSVDVLGPFSPPTFHVLCNQGNGLQLHSGLNRINFARWSDGCAMGLGIFPPF
jgi:hypothetical protein